MKTSAKSMNWLFCETILTLLISSSILMTSGGVSSVSASSSPVSTIGTTKELRCTRGIMEVGGYFFCFYMRSPDYHLVYRSSSDGVNWNPDQDVSALETLTGYGVFTDGINILVGFYNGTDSISDMTAVSFYIRNGTQSGGIITWSTAIKLTQGGTGSMHGISFCKTSAGCYWVSFCYLYMPDAPWYCVSVYNSWDLSRWDLSLKTSNPNLVYSGSCSEIQITYDPQYSNGVMLVSDPYGPSAFGYTVFDNNEWSPPSTFGSKTAEAYDFTGWSLATGNNQIQFISEPGTWSTGRGTYVPGPLTYYNYTTSWSNGVLVDSSTCWGPSLTPYNSTTMYLFYYNSSMSAVYYRALTYSTMTWSEPETLVTGETLVVCCPVLSEQNPQSPNIGVVWGGGAGNNLNVKFTWLSMLSIVAVSRIPAIPNYSEGVTVTANIISSGLVDQALLSYTYSSAWHNASMIKLGDTFNSTIPPQPYGTLTQYKIYARSSYGDWVTSELYSYTVGDFTAPEATSSQTPSHPSSTSTVKVYANVTEPVNASGVKTVLFHYRVSNGPWWNTTMTFNQTLGLYESSIPQTQQTGAWVEYFVEARDNAENSAIKASSYTAGLPGDYNGDGIVDTYDLAWLGKTFGAKNGDSQYDPNVDFNTDQIIDTYDLAILGKNFGKRYP